MKQISIKISRLLCFSLFFMLTAMLFNSCREQEKQSLNWSFKVGERIQATPVINNEVVYFGSNDSIFYALDAMNGKKLWKKKTGNMVRSQAVIDGPLIYFSSGNDLYAIEKNTGGEMWTHRSVDTTGSSTMDPWDYHQGSPVIYDSRVFAGFGNGLLKGFDLHNGGVKFSYQSLDSSPIRSTPVINDEVIYFGDWNGRVYAVNLISEDTLWTHRTYGEQPYPTFGMVNTRMLIYDTLLIFGARNPELQVVSIHTGKKVWLHTEVDGGWISGDPNVSGDTLYIGGSDNHKLIAFDVYSGDIFWEYEFLFNNFSSPVIKGDYVFFTTGDAYAFNGDYYGNGYLYALNRNNGSIINMMHFDGNMFSSPVFFKDKIILGGDDGTLHAIDYQEFVGTTSNFPENGSGPVSDIQIEYDTINNTQTLTYLMKFESPLRISVLNFEGEILKVLFDEEQNVGKHELSWDGINEANQFVADGYYFFEIRSGMFIKNKITLFVQK